jgi:membrane-bound serine protease (ClpP class)
MAAWTVTLVRLVVRSQQLRSVTGATALVGMAAIADGDLAPEGWVKLQGERWRAIAEGGARAGERLRVDAVDGLRLRVHKEG